MPRDLIRRLPPVPLCAVLLTGALLMGVAPPAHGEEDEAVSDIPGAMSRICSLVAAEARELLVAEDMDGFETRLEVLEESGCAVADDQVGDPDSWVPPILAESFPTATCFEFYRMADHAAAHGLAADARTALRGYDRLGCAGQAPPAPSAEPAPTPAVATGGLSEQEHAALVRRLNDRYCGYRNACYRADWSTCMETGIPGMEEQALVLSDACLRAAVERAVCMFEQGCAPDAAACSQQGQDEASACAAEQEALAQTRERITAASGGQEVTRAPTWAQTQSPTPAQPARNGEVKPDGSVAADPMGETRHRDWLLDGGTLWGSYVDLDFVFLSSDMITGGGMGMEAGGSVNIFAPSRNSSGWAFLKLGIGAGFNILAIEIDSEFFSDDLMMVNFNLPLTVGAYAGGRHAAVGFRWVPTYQHTIIEDEENSTFNASGFAFDLEFMSREQILTRATRHPGFRMSAFMLPPTSSGGLFFVVIGLGVNWY